MAAPNPLYDRLRFDDKEAYDFILEAQGQEAADAYLTKVLTEYEEQKAAQQFEAEKKARIEAEKKGQTIPFVPRTPAADEYKIQRQQLEALGMPVPDFMMVPEGAGLTGPEAQQASETAGGFDVQQDFQRQLPGIDPQGPRQIPMDEVITLRREQIPTPYDIRAQADKVISSINIQQNYLGLPTYQEVEDKIYEALKADYEATTGKRIRIGDMFEHEVAILEYDLRQIAAEKARQFETSDKFATSSVEGEFGYDRPRQAGDPFNMQPSVSKETAGRLQVEPDLAGTESWMVDLNPWMEGETDLGSLALLWESLMPQTIVSPQQAEQQKRQKEQIQQNFLDEMAKSAKQRKPDAFERAERLGGKSYEMALQDEITQSFSDLYFRQYDRLYTKYKQEGLPEEEAQAKAKKEARDIVGANVPFIPDTDEYGFTKKMMEEKYRPESDKTMGEQAMEMGGDVLTYLATNEDEKTGEITESVGMALIRDLNMPFRLVLNPLEEIMEAGAGGTSGQNVGDSFYDLKTYDFTEETSGFFPTMDAYLREVAVETARGYGLGNAMANYNQTESGSDGYMIMGTVAEIIMPWGTIAKGSQKLATTAIPLNKAARAMDLGADASRLTRIGEGTGNPSIAMALRDIGPTESFGYLSSTYSVNNKIALEGARQMEALDAARQYSLLMSRGQVDEAQQIVSKMGKDKLQEKIFADLISGTTDDATRFTQLDGVIDDIGKQQSIYGDMAREIRKEGRVDLGVDNIPQELGRAKGGATAEQLTERAAERLAKYNIEDYVAFTDRMAVNSEVLGKHYDSVVDFVDTLNKRPVRELTPENLNLPPQLLRRDAEMARIMDKLRVADDPGSRLTEALTPQEQIYFTNRMMEDFMRGKLGKEGAGAFMQTSPTTKRAMMPEELRSEKGARPLAAQLIGQGDTVERLTRGQSMTRGAINLTTAASRYADEVLTAGYAGNTATEIGKKMKVVAPVGVKTEMTQVNRAVDRATESVLRLERSLPEAMSTYGRYSTSAEDAIYSMFVVSGKQDPTVIIGMNKSGAKTLVQDAARTQLSQEQVLNVMRGTFPTLQKADEAYIITQIPTEGIGTIDQMAVFATKMAEEMPRLKTGMVGRPVLGKTIPDVGKVMIAISGNNAARQRVSAVARAELGPLSVPVAYRTEAGERWLYGEALRYLELGYIENTPNIARLTDDTLEAGTLQARARDAGMSDVRIVGSIEFGEAATEEQMRAIRQRALVLSEVEDDIIDLANQLRARGLELNLTPEQVSNQMRYQVETIIDGGGQAITGVGSTQELAKLKQLYAEPETFRTISSNVEELSKNNPGLLNWTRKTLGLTAGDVRRSFVSGQLAGKYLYGNPSYIAENAATQMLLSTITAPGSNRLLFKGYMTPGAIDAASLNPPQKIRAVARTERANEIMPGTRYTYAQIADALQTRNLGATQQTINMGDVFLEDMVQTAARAETTTNLGNFPYFSKAATEVVEMFKYSAKNPLLKTSSSSPAQRFSIYTDYVFREQMFVGALADGKTIDEAAQLARTAFLDYGNLPQWSKEGWFRGALYFSFAYRTAAETAKAIANPKASANLARLARGHVAMTQYTGTYFFTGDQALQSVFITANDADKDGFDSVNLYYRDPWMSNLMLGAQTFTYLTQAAQGDPEASMSRGIDGILDYLYMPALEVIQDLDPDYKKGVPPKTMYRILMAQQMAGNIPDIFQAAPGAIGANVPQDAMYYIDRYDLEVRPPSKMVPGQPTFMGYQYRFTTKEGYNAFYLDSLFLATTGAKRMADDATSMMIQAGIIPAGAEFGYLENGTPVLYMLGRERPMRLPKEWEIYDRQMRSQQYRLRQLNKTFGEPKDTKAGDRK
tara:strand:+ start:6144 stop:11705 length:5562 start_codon:yes stop_codon:yes gene_type:complete